MLLPAAAPTLEITVSGDATGAAAGKSTTYSFGRAFARAALEGSEAAFGDGSDLSIDDLSSYADESFDDFSSTDDLAALDTPADMPADTSGDPGASTPSKGEGATIASARIADWSIAPGYSAMGVGALLLLAAWVGLERIAVRLRWR